MVFPGIRRDMENCRSEVHEDKLVKLKRIVDDALATGAIVSITIEVLAGRIRVFQSPCRQQVCTCSTRGNK